MRKNYEDRYLHLGLNISYFRKLRKMSQLQLAEYANCSRTHISNIEAPGIGKSVSLDLLFSIAEALDVEPSRLLEIRE